MQTLIILRLSFGEKTVVPVIEAFVEACNSKRKSGRTAQAYGVWSFVRTFMYLSVICVYRRLYKRVLVLLEIRDIMSEARHFCVIESFALNVGLQVKSRFYLMLDCTGQHTIL